MFEHTVVCPPPFPLLPPTPLPYRHLVIICPFSCSPSENDRLLQISVRLPLEIGVPTLEKRGGIAPYSSQVVLTRPQTPGVVFCSTCAHMVSRQASLVLVNSDTMPFVPLAVQIACAALDMAIAADGEIIQITLNGANISVRHICIHILHFTGIVDALWTTYGMLHAVSMRL